MSPDAALDEEDFLDDPIVEIEPKDMKEIPKFSEEDFTEEEIAIFK